jgi:spore coat protein CotH
MRTPLAALTLTLAAATTAPAADPAFDPGRLHEVRLTMDPNDWKALRQNYRTNDYYAANIAIDGEVVLQVGIRSRGAGSRNEEKPGLKVDFNKYVTNQEFHGYKSLVLDNLVQDQSLLRERLAYDVFERMGIAAPQNAHCRLTVNDEYWGVYGIVEAVSKPFLKARIGEESGTLYDYEWVDNYYFTVRGGGERAAYVPAPFEPQTNENKLDDGLAEFVRAINDTAGGASFATAMAGWLDVDRFLTHIAVENALAETDGVLGYAGMNNFYLYQYGGQKRFVFIPWDKDTSFSNPSFPILSRVEENVLSRKLLSDAAQKQRYQELVKKTVNDVLNSAVLGARLEAAYSQIREAVLADTKKPYSNDAFELSVTGLRGIIAGRQADVLAQVQ